MEGALIPTCPRGLRITPPGGGGPASSPAERSRKCNTARPEPAEPRLAAAGARAAVLTFSTLRTRLRTFSPTPVSIGRGRGVRVPPAVVGRGRGRRCSARRRYRPTDWLRPRCRRPSHTSSEGAPSAGARLRDTRRHRGAPCSGPPDRNHRPGPLTLQRGAAVSCSGAPLSRAAATYGHMTLPHLDQEARALLFVRKRDLVPFTLLPAQPPHSHRKRYG